MAKFAYLTLCFIFISYHSSMAQKQDYSKGRVLDSESKQPLSDVNVKFYQSSSVLYQTHTDTAGYFYLPNKLIEVFNLLKIDHLGYSSIEIKKDKMYSKSLTSSLGQFELKRTAFLLKEVVIEKDRQYSDTSIIDLSKENFHRSIMIDDLFSMNGLSKDKYGQLFFKGKPISNITLNGSDFFGKNNTKIYDKLPALTLENIEIVETNIDSITNTHDSGSSYIKERQPTTNSGSLHKYY